MMFRLLFLTIVAMAMSCFAAPPPKRTIVHWMSYDEAFEKAKKAPKLIFVDLYADWCVPCRIMEANVYSDPTVASLLNTRFYSVKLNADSQDTIMCDGQKKTVPSTPDKSPARFAGTWLIVIFLRFPAKRLVSTRR